jgi:hypothetical protein
MAYTACRGQNNRQYAAQCWTCWIHSGALVYKGPACTHAQQRDCES